MRLIALYLPQFHTFPENDLWWGEGYTEWTAVRRSKPLFKGHNQPKTPLLGYYDLVKDGRETLIKQAALMKYFGIYGFAFYQYYFTGKKLMEKPLEILLSNPDIDMNYCLCWANESWTRAWYGLKEEVLLRQEYGDRSGWRAHFEYNLKFFKDQRYIKEGNKPVYMIYRTFDIEKLPEMKKCWDGWAREEGFDGIFWIGGNTAGVLEKRRKLLNGFYDFEPGYTLKHGLCKARQLKYNLFTGIRHIANHLPWRRREDKKRLERKIPINWIYDGISSRDYAENEYPGILTEWDNTPRRGYKGLLYTGASPGKFYNTLKILKEKVEGRKEDFVFLNAWNEWGEGANIEPDTNRRYAYLNAVRKCCCSKE